MLAEEQCIVPSLHRLREKFVLMKVKCESFLHGECVVSDFPLISQWLDQDCWTHDTVIFQCSLTLLLFVQVSPDNQTLANRSCCFELQKVWGRTGLELSEQQLLGEGECLVSQRVPSADCDTENLVIYGFHLFSDALSGGKSEQPCSPPNNTSIITATAITAILLF